MNKKLFLLFHGRFPSEKAAALFAAKSAETFGMQVQTVLIVPRRLGRVRSNPFSYYSIQENFKIVYIPTIDLYSVPFLNHIAFPVSYIIFSILALFYLLFKGKKNDIYYSNEHLSLLPLTFVFKNTFYEMHDFPTERSYFYYKFFLKKIRWVLIHNKWKAEMAKDKLRLNPAKIICKPNAVELSQFQINISKQEARETLGLSLESKIVVYTGHLYGWKGADTLALAAGTLPDEVMVYFVGGTEGDVRSFKDKFGKSNVIFVGHRNHKEIPLWQTSADILVIPNTAKEDISKYYTSPMKLFEYMASGRPIVASRIPSIEEIVTEDEVNFFEPDNVADLAGVILDCLLNPDDISNKVVNAQKKVAKHTWQGRAQRILEFIKQSK